MMIILCASVFLQTFHPRLAKVFSFYLDTLKFLGRWSWNGRNQLGRGQHFLVWNRLRGWGRGIRMRWGRGFRRLPQQGTKLQNEGDGICHLLASACFETSFCSVAISFSTWPSVWSATSIRIGATGSKPMSSAAG